MTREELQEPREWFVVAKNWDGNQCNIGETLPGCSVRSFFYSYPAGDVCISPIGHILSENVCVFCLWEAKK